jgi:hypothetical protein
MEFATLPSGTWVFFAGNFNYSPGTITGKSGRKYKMMAIPSSGSPYLDSNVLQIAERECEIEP